MILESSKMFVKTNRYTGKKITWKMPALGVRSVGENNNLPMMRTEVETFADMIARNVDVCLGAAGENLYEIKPI